MSKDIEDHMVVGRVVLPCRHEPDDGPDIFQQILRPPAAGTPKSFTNEHIAQDPAAVAEKCAEIAEMMAAGAKDARSAGSDAAPQFGLRIAAEIRAWASKHINKKPKTAGIPLCPNCNGEREESGTPGKYTCFHCGMTSA